MDIEKVEAARRIVNECAEMIAKIKSERQTILLNQEQSKSKLFGLQDTLGKALAQAIINPDVSAQTKINAIRKEIDKTSEFLSDAPLMLQAFDVLEKEQKQKRLSPQADIRNAGEARRQKELNLSLQRQLLSLAASSEQYMWKPEFLTLTERFKKNALSLDQEAQADEFLRTLKG